MADARKIYGDIIDHPHFADPTRERMSRANRAAQFSPFAALTGYGDLIDEAARYTDEKTEPDEDLRASLDRKLSFLLRQPAPPAVTVTFFAADPKKDGGAYETAEGRLLRFDSVRKIIVLDGGRRIPLEDITDITGDCLSLLP